MKEPLTLLKSPRDERDWHYGKIVCAGGELPERVSLRQSCGPIRRQGKSGFCHSFAAVSYTHLMAGQLYKHDDISIAQIYMNEFFEWMERLAESGRKADGRNAGSGGWTSVKGYY